MCEETKLIINENEELETYYDTYDVVIHCESQDDQEQVEKILLNLHWWIPITDRLPTNDEYILLSFENYSLPAVGRYEEDETGGAFYVGDSDKPCTAHGIFVNAWMPLPECYKREEDE